MSLEKGIKSGKEHRKEYRGAKRIDPSCRNHGNCSWCEENRKYQDKKSKERCKKELTEYKKGINI